MWLHLGTVVVSCYILLWRITRGGNGWHDSTRSVTKVWLFELRWCKKNTCRRFIPSITIDLLFVSIRSLEYLDVDERIASFPCHHRAGRAFGLFIVVSSKIILRIAAGGCWVWLRVLWYSSISSNADEWFLDGRFVTHVGERFEFFWSLINIGQNKMMTWRNITVVDFILFFLAFVDNRCSRSFYRID